MLTKRLLGICLLSALTLACSNRLEDYTQLTMAVTVPENVNDIDGEAYAITEGILNTRLAGLGINTAEIEATEDNQLLVRLPRPLPKGTDVLAAEEVLTNPGLLTLRNQKPDTEEDLAASIETLQRLLVEQETLVQTEKLTEAEALQPDIDKTRDDILALFDPSELTGDYLADARARQMEDKTWAVNIQFDEAGTALFAEQTKLMAGTGRAIGLFLDNVLLSTPIVAVDFSEKGIDSGSAVISGNFTQAAAKELEIQLKSGALPVELETVEIASSADEETESAPDSVSEESEAAPEKSEPEEAEHEAKPEAENTSEEKEDTSKDEDASKDSDD